MRQLNRRQRTLLLLFLTLAVLLAVTLAGALLTQRAMVTDFSRMNRSPSLTFLFGTDWMGLDMLARTLAWLSLSIRIGVLTAHSGSLTPEHFRQAGVPDAQIDALAIAGMENFPVFRKTILEGAAPVMDTDAVGAEIGAAAAAMTDGQPLDALLLECTDLSVFARTVQEAVSVPVYDINSLIAYAAFCVRRNQWV